MIYGFAYKISAGILWFKKIEVFGFEQEDRKSDEQYAAYPGNDHRFGLHACIYRDVKTADADGQKQEDASDHSRRKLSFRPYIR